MEGCSGKCEACANNAQDASQTNIRGDLLIFSCSGGSNVAEIADQVARSLMDEGWGGMYCVAGLAAEIPGMTQTALNARLNVLLDGCGLDCVRRFFDKQKIHNYLHIRLSDLGIEKTRSRRARPDEITLALQKVRHILSGKCPGKAPAAPQA